MCFDDATSLGSPLIRYKIMSKNDLKALLLIAAAIVCCIVLMIFIKLLLDLNAWLCANGGWGSFCFVYDWLNSL